MRPSRTNTGKVYDPVFLFMLGAVILAIGSSFALRAVVTGLGPNSAHAADQSPDQSSDQSPDQSPAVDNLPAPSRSLLAADLKKTPTQK